VPDRGWKKAERRLARDVGTERIPVTGQRHGADFEDGIAAYQVKVRRCLPGWLWTWYSGIKTTAAIKKKAGVLVLKRPRERDDDAIVILSWRDWRDLHGDPSAR